MYLTLFRVYDPNTGRWLSRDPLGEKAGVNLYDYVGGNPAYRIDRDGRWWQIPMIAGIVVGGLYFYKHCLDQCNQGGWCPTDPASRKRFGQCAEYCTNLVSLWTTILDGGFFDTKPPMPSPTSTTGTVGGAIGSATQDSQ
jgi:hypothetical protein